MSTPARDAWAVAFNVVDVVAKAYAVRRKGFHDALDSSVSGVCPIDSVGKIDEPDILRLGHLTFDKGFRQGSPGRLSGLPRQYRR